MARHRDTTSRSVIDALLRLGVALGYTAEPEHQVGTSGAAVDVAWMNEPGAPLFIFEVETRVSNSAANNATKVYGQPNQQLAKPLFFFHLFLSRHDSSERIDALRTLFGTQNYRAYCFGAGELTRLVNDVLAQHRRVAAGVDLLSLAEALDHNGFASIDRDGVLREVEALGFDACFVPDYALLARNAPLYRPHLVRQILNEDLYPHPREGICWYRSYLGGVCAAPLHLGILARLGSEDEAVLLERLGAASHCLRPAFGLSREHDDFTIGWSPSIWALIGALFVNRDSRRYCAHQLRVVVEACQRLRDPGEALYPALWLLWLAAAAESDDDYATAAGVINERGGINPDFLATPPSVIGFAEREHEWWAEFDRARAPAPSLSDFRPFLSAGHVDPVALALEALLEDDTVFEWAPRICSALGSPRGSPSPSPAVTASAHARAMNL